MKAYTDIEQSKKLAEFLPLESADMYYQYVLPKSDKIKHNPEIGNPINALKWYNKGYTMSGKEPITLDEYCITAWSLTALIELLPKRYNNDSVYMPLVGKYYEDNKFICGYFGDGLLDWTFGENPIDACVEMIVKLHELKLL